MRTPRKLMPGWAYYIQLVTLSNKDSCRKDEIGLRSRLNSFAGHCSAAFLHTEVGQAASLQSAKPRPEALNPEFLRSPTTRG